MHACHGRISTVDSPEKLRSRSSGLQSIEVSFSKAVNINELTKIQGVNEAKKAGDKVRLYVDDPSVVIDKLAEFARSRKIRITSLSTLAPTLEDVFLKFVREGKKGGFYGR